jgi:RHS repeat-associated protein
LWWSEIVSGSALDANGNTTSSAGIANTYDFENRMLTHGSLALVYDGDGNRVSETVGGTTTKFLVDDLNPTGYQQIIDELVNGSVARTYAYGLERISENQLINATWTPSFYGYDGHGNVRFLTNSAGTITDSYDDDAFGMPIRTSGTTANQYRYGGERSDSSIGLYDLRARYFNQATGRFWARDPAEGISCTPLSFNPYIYTLDNPVNRIDPTGRESVDYALSLRLPTLTIPAQITLAIALACATEEDATGFGSIFYNAITGNNPLNIQQAGPCVIKPKPCNCKPCEPPVGTLAYRMDLPPSPPHRGVDPPHWHLYEMNQNPKNCQCFWVPIDDNKGGFGTPPPPPGAVPITPAAGGGCQ